MYRAYNARPIPQPRPQHQNKHTWVFYLLAVLVVAGVYAAYCLLRPMAAAKTTILPPVISAQVSVNIPWPAAGQAAFGADGYGLLATHKDQKPSPTASVTKVITAMSILEKKPLKKGEAGPMITLTEKDVALYNQYVAKDGAAVPVAAGEQISEYQALQAMLLPSANNIADSAAIWAFGSLEAYTAHANGLVKRLGMLETTVSDASGFSSATVSTPRDLIRLGDAALDHPVLAEIVSQTEAVFPGYGTITNVNNLLGSSGIRGIKTGNTEEAGGCYLAAADITVSGEKVTVITAIMGSTSRPQAMRDSVPIIQAAVSEFEKVAVVKAGETVGHVTTPWGARSEAVAEKDIQVLTWSGTALAPTTTVTNPSSPAPSGTTVGALTLNYLGKTLQAPVVIKSALPGPTALWRLTHPF